MSDTLYTLVSGVTGFQQVENTPVHVNTNALLLSGHLGTSTNATINGNITVTGTVDGRDVAADGITTDQNFTTLNTGSARWNTNANTEIAAASARYSRTATSLETNVVPNTADWNYTAANSAITLETSSHDYLSISNREITLGQVDISDDTNLAANNGITLTGDTLSIDSVSASNFTAAYDHSRGNVTDHADVSNAGSGQIITAEERDRLDRSWTRVSGNSALVDQIASNLETDIVPNSADWNYTAANTAISVAFDVTNNGSGAYRFNNGGFTNDDNPTVHLQRGHTYRFRVNASGHPFYLKTSAGTGTGNQYLSGVSGNGAQVGNVDFEVPHDAPRQLFYQCSAHSSMVGSIHVVEGTATTAVFNNSANWNNAYTRSNNNFSTLNSNSARYSRTALSVETNVVPNSADWNYTAANSAAHANEFSFKTITLSANRASAATGADIVADSTTDTLTLCAGPNIELISEPGSDVITISGSAGGGSGGGEDNEFSFKTITLSANRTGAAIGADIVADTTTDTLTLCAGPNIQLLSEVGSDVITISGGTSIIDNSTNTNTYNSYYSGAGPTVAYQQTLTGNGSTTIFEVSANIPSDFLALVLIEGVMQIPTTHYTVSASHVHSLSTVKDMVFNTAPGDGERIDVRVFKDANTTEQVSTTTENYSGNGASATYQQTLTGDGSTTIFEVSAKIIDPILAVVNINGIIQEPTSHYTVSASHVHSGNTNVRDMVFTQAPGNGERIGVRVFQDAVADIDNTTTVNNTVYSGATVTSTSNLTGDGSTHVFEVSARLSEAAMAIVSVGGIVQIPTTHYTVSAAAAHLTNADVADINFSIAPLSGELIEIRGLHDGTVLNETTIVNTYTTVNNNSASWALTVKEADGSPNVTAVSAITVTNGTLTDNGNGHVSIDTGGSGGGTDLTVSEIDGTPSVSAVSAIKVTNGTLTVSNGTATIDTGGGGSTGPFTSASGKFYSTNGNDKMGLGTSAPVYKLDITDTAAAFIHLSGKGNSAEAGIHMYTDARGGYTIYMENSSEGNDDTLIFNCGTTASNATVMLLSAIPNSANTGLLDINHIYARTKIGIGTDNPGEALSVVGNISASGDITVANNSYKFADGQKLTSSNVTDLKSASAGSISVTNLGTDNTPTIDFNAGQMQKVAINGNCTFQDATNISAGGNVVLEITGDSGGARTLAFPSGWKFIGAKPTTIKTSGLSLLQLLVFAGSGQSNVVCTYNTQD